MKNTLSFLLLFTALYGTAQKPYWQQQVDVTMQVQLHAIEHTLDGFETLHYTNHSPDTLRYIWFHVWPNAYKNDHTAFSDQLLQLGNTSFYFSSKEQRGYINQLHFKVDGITATVEDHPEHIDIIKVVLPWPLPPGNQITITTPFHVMLPYLLSRSGYKNNAFQITQWYPKPAVYDAQGWHPMPYLEQGEFYSEFGNYDVTITLPQDYVVAATGVLQNSNEVLPTTQKKAVDTELKPSLQKKGYGHLKKFPTAATSTSSDSNFLKASYPVKALQYKQQQVHDFAWIADKNFKVNSDTCQLASGKIISVYTYYIDRPGTVWKKGLQFVKDALRFYSKEVGDYPYTTMRVAESAGEPGGMEYPTLSIIGPVDSEKSLDLLIAHEVGHNWFYGALATNERDAPWLDEGINSFYEKKYTTQKYGANTPWETVLFQTLAWQKRDQPITTTAPAFSAVNYALVAYDKTASWLKLVEQQSGLANLQQAMHNYYNQWRYKHPQANNFKQAIATALPDTTVFRFLNTTSTLPNQQLAKWKIVTPFVPGTIKSYINDPSENTWFITPAFGYNLYDNRMIGGMITNYGLPPARMQFLAIPLYATGSKKWNGIGNIRYNIYSNSWFRKLQFEVAGMGFSKSYMLDSNSNARYERFYKLAPTARMVFNEPIQSTRERWLEAKRFLIRETNFSTFVTKASDGRTYVDSLSKSSRYVNQLTWNVTDYRTLYPYNYQLQLQQGQSFYRMNVTGNYFLNYAKGGGAGVRLFFATFGYLTNSASQRLETTKYQPKLLGNSGEDDYTYSSYFIGRTASYANDASVVKNSGLAAQQIMLRDGAFKLRLDPFDFLQGRSEHWVAALNLNTTLPRQLIPAFIPLRLFLDVGTYAEAKKDQSATGRILYVGGLQLSFLHDVVALYAPLVYSSVFRNNLKTLPEQNTFLKRLTFSLDFRRLSLKQVTSNKFSF